MSDLHIHFRDARRQPLNDSLDVRVVESATNVLKGSKRNVSGRKVLVIKGLLPGQPYVITALPKRYRPVGQIVMMPPQGKADVHLHFPLHPDHVQATFQPYAQLEADLRDVLERSAVESTTATGRALYDALQPTERAGLLNLYCKMRAFGFDAQHSVWSAVDRLYRIRPDRIFAEVDVALRDRVKTAEAEGRFREVSGTLHTPPPGYRSASSFKTDERYGNLQLSFFASEDAPLRFKVDADIDDAAGIGHTFQVLRNWVSSGTTHPYDIHQILVYRQEAFPPYDLA
jgi:hypothetical protein